MNATVIWACEINRLRGNRNYIHHQLGEVVMELAIAFGALVSVFVLGAAVIIWFPYDKDMSLQDR
jgi:hypothetical protein